MHARSLSPTLILAVALLLGSGCATVPEPLAGEYPDLRPEQASERSLGTRVRWGGEIVDTRPGGEKTCIEILQRKLDSRLRPIGGDAHGGRFLACRDGFEDPAVFSSGREVTVVGQLRDFVEGSVGDFQYTYPRLDAETLYLWAELPDGAYLADPWWHDPWWPYYRHGFWYPRTRFHGHILIGK